MKTTPVTYETLIPRPASLNPGSGEYTLTADSAIVISPASEDVRTIAQYFAGRLSPATGFDLKIAEAGNIYLSLNNSDTGLGEEGYELTVSLDSVKLTADKPAGLFRGVQTFRQLLPPAIEKSTKQAGSWTIPAVTIRDMPRFEWRGAMLDVSRHFFGVADVKRLIDQLAYYKMNRLHLHLTDDQGWRLMINSWPRLAEYGGTSAVGGAKGGYYTQAEYADIVAYAAKQYIMIVPEIDMPSHSNAALAAYPNLDCSGKTPELYTGTEVGFSTFCIRNEEVYAFLDEVIRELAALTPGPYIHIGGDEAHVVKEPDYIYFMERAQEIVRKNGKQVIGWDEISKIDLLPGTIVQYWNGKLAEHALAQGANLIVSPAAKAYADMKYDASTPLGLDWAGCTGIQDAYAWDPATYLQGVKEDNVLGIETALWTETILTMDDIEYMFFPRLPGYAELGWSPVEGKSWDEYKARLAEQGKRLESMDINFYRSPEVNW